MDQLKDIKLFAKGYTQLERVDYLDTFSSIAKLTTMKIHLATATIKNEYLHINWTLIMISYMGT